KKTVVVCSFGTGGNGLNSGSAHVFVWDWSAWTHQAKLLAPDGDPYDYFGVSVGIHNDTVIVGAYGDDDKGSNSGLAHVFVQKGVSWTHEAKLLTPYGAEEDRFGFSVGVYGGTVVVGAARNNHNAIDSLTDNSNNQRNPSVSLVPTIATKETQFFNRNIQPESNTHQVSSYHPSDIPNRTSMRCIFSIPPKQDTGNMRPSFCCSFELE
ncbi:hypothetical protein ACHAWF_018058, partial [Thalassiosira exigua]